MTSVIVYHDTATLARRNYSSRPDETVAHRSIEEWNDEANEKFDRVLDLSTPVKKKAKNND